MFLPFKISPRLCSISVEGWCAPGARLASLRQQQFRPGGPCCGAQGEGLGVLLGFQLMPEPIAVPHIQISGP